MPDLEVIIFTPVSRSILLRYISTSLLSSTRRHFLELQLKVNYYATLQLS